MLSNDTSTYRSSIITKSIAGLFKVYKYWTRDKWMKLEYKPTFDHSSLREFNKSDFIKNVQWTLFINWSHYIKKLNEHDFFHWLPFYW